MGCCSSNQTQVQSDIEPQDPSGKLEEGGVNFKPDKIVPQTPVPKPGAGTPARKFRSNSKVLVVGASGSGKTCLVRRLRLHALEKANEPEDVGKELRGAFFKSMKGHDPTIGADLSSLQLSGMSFEMVELGGMPELREMWDSYFAGTDAILLVVGNTRPHADAEPFINPLKTLLKDKQLASLPLLVVVNASKNRATGQETFLEKVELEVRDVLEPLPPKTSFLKIICIQLPTTEAESTSAGNSGLKACFEWLSETAALERTTAKNLNDVKLVV